MQIDGNLPNFIILKHYNKREWKGIWIDTCKAWNWTFIVQPFLYIYRMGLNVIKVTIFHLLGMLGLRGLDSKLSTFNLHQYIHASFMKFNYFNIVEGQNVFSSNEGIFISCNYGTLYFSFLQIYIIWALNFSTLRTWFSSLSSWCIWKIFKIKCHKKRRLLSF
jgi:hypothetical protein